MGDKFFIIEEGEAFAQKVMEKGGNPKTVKEYTKGGYFGELALIKNEPRAATVIAKVLFLFKGKTDCKLLTIDRASFKRLLGPIENLLKRNSDTYMKFIQK